MSQENQGRYVSAGLSIDYTPGADVEAGDVVVQNNIVGIAKVAIEDSMLGALAIAGVFDVVKAEEAFATVGAHIFWDEDGDPYNGEAGTGCATATSVGNTWMGYVLVAAGSTDEAVRCILRSTISLTAETFSLADLSDIEAVDYTEGDILIGDGTKYVDLPLTGPFSLAASGLLSVSSATVAAAGSVQGDAGALAEGFTLVSAADATKGVVLPAAVAGGLCIVKNNANAVLKIWPNTSDAIDALGADNAMSVPAYETVRLIAYNATTWYTENHTLASLLDIDAVDYTAGDILIGDGAGKYADVPLSGPFNLSSAGLLSMDSATVAAAGSVQGDAGALTDGFTLVSAADATKGVVLPAAAAGGICVVTNNANAVLKVWPNTSDAIDAEAGDANIAMPAYATRTFIAYDATTWYSSGVYDAELAIAKLTSWTEGNVAVDADALVIPITHRHVSKTTGGDGEALTLADGVAGQLLTIDLVVDGGGSGTLTPTTMTGFATIVFADAGDQVTLQFIDASVGWVIVGASGVAGEPVITI